MGWGVLIWSLATLLTPWAARQSLAALLAMRVVMGLAEGVAMPCMNNMIHKYAHFPFIFLCVSDVSIDNLIYEKSSHLSIRYLWSPLVLSNGVQCNQLLRAHSFYHVPIKSAKTIKWH